MDQSHALSEAEFADSQYAQYSNDLDINPKFLLKYSNPTQLWDWRQFAARLLGDVEGKSLLDFGCGLGEEAAYFAKLGAQVTAIDVSEVGVASANARAQHNGLQDRLVACIRDATCTSFADDFFDIVHGMGILHHVGLEEGLSEVRRVLKPGGVAVFLEPLGNSPWVEKWKGRLYRKLHRKLHLINVNEDERPITKTEILRFAKEFSYSKVYPFHLTFRARKLFAPTWAWPYLRRFDSFMLRAIPVLSYYAGAAVIHLKK